MTDHTISRQYNEANKRWFRAIVNMPPSEARDKHVEEFCEMLDRNQENYERLVEEVESLSRGPTK